MRKRRRRTSWKFLLTRPMRGATITCTATSIFFIISTHTPHAGRDIRGCFPQCRKGISTHTPHAGRDGISRATYFRELISTHTPHAGRDLRLAFATQALLISTHTPHAGRDKELLNSLAIIDISTHTPHAGRDRRKQTGINRRRNFYSHAPCGARQLQVK